MARCYYYKVVFVSNENATNSDDGDNATLGNMLAMFADVMSTRPVEECLSEAPTKAA
jgi:hypothetical protein